MSFRLASPALGRHIEHGKQHEVFECVQHPSLFNGCHVYLVPQPGPYAVGDLQLSKVELVTLIGSGDGVLLGREPDPEAIPPSQCMVPYHIVPGSPLANCSHYLVYQPGGRGEPRLKYNMAHIKSLPITWLLACVQTFSLVQPGP
ncbi:hypothetical protein PR048_017596 [Dryococelus australis]|uniref:Uncharacterized protein n=1 Tax=Dryococelus australis TaxID=614101 RepID=A0ABQ9HAJ0_9NEOP|nr:hypothetical protein PR048_017596 [Dryococelus australis]